MGYFNSRDIAAIALFAALWAVLNSLFSPIFFRIFGLPFLCDLIGFTALTISVWWTKKLGAITMVGIIATIINFILNPGAVHFLGFTAASVVFDALARFVGYQNSFRSSICTMISMTAISTLSATVAGLIIGTFFMAAPALSKWGGVMGWAILHGVGGVIGGIIGANLVIALSSRIAPTGVKKQEIKDTTSKKQTET